MKPPEIQTFTNKPVLDIAAAVRPVHKIRTSGEHDDPRDGGLNVARALHERGGKPPRYSPRAALLDV